MVALLSAADRLVRSVRGAVGGRGDQLGRRGSGDVRIVPVDGGGSRIEAQWTHGGATRIRDKVLLGRLHRGPMPLATSTPLRDRAGRGRYMLSQDSSHTFGNTSSVGMVRIASVVRVGGLVALLAGPLLALVGGHFSVATYGLLLLTLGRIWTRGPIGYIDRTVGAVGVALLVMSVVQPMYWLMPSAELLGGGLAACLSRVWRGSELAVCLLLLPGPLVTIFSIGALLWLGDTLPGPHGAAELVFGLASLYGPIAGTALSVSWWLGQRQSPTKQGVDALASGMSADRGA